MEINVNMEMWKCLNDNLHTFVSVRLRVFGSHLTPLAAMLTWLIVALTVSVSGTLGQRKYCCAPDQYESQDGTVVGSADDEGHNAVSIVNVALSYDAKATRVHMTEQVETGNVTRQLQQLFLYDQNVLYIIENGKCTRAPSGPWKPSCIFDNATETRQYFLGGKQHIHVTEYQQSAGQETSLIAVTDGCVPVSVIEFGNVDGDNIFSATGFQGVTAGIKDPSIFNVPSICAGAQPHPTPRRRRSHWQF